MQKERNRYQRNHSFYLFKISSGMAGITFLNRKTKIVKNNFIKKN
jgi:hypothetical protein